MIVGIVDAVHNEPVVFDSCRNVEVGGSAHVGRDHSNARLVAGYASGCSIYDAG